MPNTLSTMNLFERGTYITCTAVTDMPQMEGVEMTFDDLDLSSADGVKVHRSNRKVVCRCVRNVSGIALLPKRSVIYSTTSGTYGNRVDGYSYTTAQKIAGIVDEWLPAAGVPNLCLFWIVVEGPSDWLTNIASLGSNTVAVGGNLVALTAATSQATTAGRLEVQDLTGATAPLANQAQNLVGTAQEAATTGQTNAGIQVDIKRQ